MKIEKEYLDNHQVKVVAEFEPELLENFKRQAARRISREQKIPGFRPGKAPYEIIRRNFGEEAIEQQAIEIMLDDVYPKVLDEAEIKPSGPGALDKISSKNPPIFEFLIPLAPEVKLGDYKTIRLDYHLEPVVDKDVDDVLQNIRSGYGTATPVERAAQEGDLVSIKIKGLLINPGEDEDPEIVKEMTRQVTMEAGSDDRGWPYADFWKEVLGLSKDDQKTVTHLFGEDAVFSRFANKEIEFQFSVENVKEMNYPEMDDAFATSVGDYKTMQELRDAVFENLEHSRTDEYEQEYMTKIVDQLVEMSEIKYSSNTLDEEVEQVLSSLEQDLGNQNLDIQTYLKYRNLEKEKFIEDEIKPVAIKRLQRSLVLDEAAQKEGIEIGEKELQESVTNTMTQLLNTPGFKKPASNQEMRKLTSLVSYDSASRILNQKIQDRLSLIAKGEYVETASIETPAEQPDEPAPKAKKAKRTKKETVKTGEPNKIPETDSTTQEPGVADA
ncbi:MAG: trigger factor [Chloroflexi bacterium]|nr:trigger factor [Chloroflexota bacterium]